MNILVSICCTTFNHENYIADALEGFLIQETNFDFEVLIHDDASTDKTPDIIRNYVDKYSNIIKPIFQIENQYSKHIKINMQYNFSRAKGKYIALCEGDDYWTDPLKLQKQVDYMENHPECSLCFHSAKIIQVTKEKRRKLLRPYIKNCISPTEDIIIGGGGFCPTASLLFPKKYIESMPEFYKSAHVGDYPLQMFLSSKGYAYYIDEIMSVYRMEVPGSWTSRVYFNVNAIDKVNKAIEGDITLLEGFNKYSNYKYAKEIDIAKLQREFKLLVHENKLKEIKSNRYRKAYTSLSFNMKIKIYFRYYFPCLYVKLKNIKEKVKEFMINHNHKVEKGRRYRI